MPDSRWAGPGWIPWRWKRDHRSDRPWTRSEDRLWHALKRATDAQVLGQWWAGELPYKVDFYVPELSLAIEVDGLSHARTVAYDRRRSEHLRDAGIDVARVTARDVITDSDAIAWQIASRIAFERGAALVGVTDSLIPA